MSKRVLHREAVQRGLVTQVPPVTWCGRRTTEVTCAVLLRDVECSRCLAARRRWMADYRSFSAKVKANETVLHEFCQFMHRPSEPCPGGYGVLQGVYEHQRDAEADAGVHWVAVRAVLDEPAKGGGGT